MGRTKIFKRDINGKEIEIKDITMKETKEQLLIRRVFKLISNHHFGDHKMSPSYINHIRFDRQLGDDISNYIQSKNPEYYNKKRKEYERN